MSNRYLRQYDGYLKQHLGLIEDMHQAGADNNVIALRLYDLGVRTLYDHAEYDRQIFNLAAMVAYIRRTWFGWKKPTPLHFWADP